MIERLIFCTDIALTKIKSDTYMTANVIIIKTSDSLSHGKGNINEVSLLDIIAHTSGLITQSNVLNGIFVATSNFVMLSAAFKSSVK